MLKFSYKVLFISVLLIFVYPLFFFHKASAKGTDDFIIIVQTDKNNSFYIPIDDKYQYNYNIDCNNDGIMEATGVKTDYLCSYESKGVYTIRIEDNTEKQVGFPHIFFYDEFKGIENLLAVQQWGTMKWQSMKNSFNGCVNVVLLAKDTPDLSNVTDMSGMFAGTISFNQDINNWDVSNVQNMSMMFSMAINFNQPLDKWDVSNVTDMSSMFTGAFEFNQPLNSWNTANVKDMFSMFTYDRNFNQPLDKWDVSNVEFMDYMFSEASSFNQPLDKWNIKSLISADHFLDKSGLSRENYDKTLQGWASLPYLEPSLTLGVKGIYYCGGEKARNYLHDAYNWKFKGDNKNCDKFICGNGIVEENEECDDHNTKNRDGCSSTCKKEYTNMMAEFTYWSFFIIFTLILIFAAILLSNTGNKKE